jgi:hypothetical protein
MEFIIWLVAFILMCVIAYFIISLLDELNSKINSVIRNVGDISEMVCMGMANSENVNNHIMELKDLNNDMNNRMLLNTQRIITENSVGNDVDDVIKKEDLDINITSEETVNNMPMNNKISYLDVVSPSESVLKNE